MQPFIEMRQDILDLGLKLFTEIIKIPQSIRPDDRERTGIQILIKEIGTRNIFLEPIMHPSIAAQHFANEKAIRLELSGQYSSANTENERVLRYEGAVAVDYGKYKIVSSICGLKSQEDVLIAIVLLAFVTGQRSQNVINQIVLKKGKLPKFLFNANHYLYEVIKSYR